MFSKFLEWRKEFNADDCLWNLDFPEERKIKEMYLFGYHHTTREGCPFYIERTGWVNVEELSNLERNWFIEYIMKDNERLIHWYLPASSKHFGYKIEKAFYLLDLAGFSARMFTKSAWEIVLLSNEVQGGNYPETMSKLFIVNTGLVFWSIWMIIKPFIDKRSLAKISIHGESFQDELFKIVDPDKTP